MDGRTVVAGIALEAAVAKIGERPGVGIDRAAILRVVARESDIDGDDRFILERNGSAVDHLRSFAVGERQVLNVERLGLSSPGLDVEDLLGVVPTDGQ